MTIQIKRVGNAYTAVVTPPHGRGSNWITSAPTNLDQLVNELLNLGCHQTDIADAFMEADSSTRPQFGIRD